VPVTVAALLFGTQVVRVLFPGNTPAETVAIAHVMMAMMVGLVPFGWLYLVQRVYYAYEDAKTPFYLQLVVTAVASAVNLLALTADPSRTGIWVGLGQTVSNLAASIVGFVLLRRWLGLLRLRSTVRLYVRLAIAAAAGALVCWPLVAWLESVLPGRGLSSLVELAVGGVVYLGVVYGLAHLMRVEEVSQLLSPVLRRVRRRPG
jgi:putative peptidoglycan lipid II flippase